MNDDLYTESDLAQPGATRYMKAPALRRGIRMPGQVKGAIAILGALALLLAAFFGMRAYDAVANAPARYAQSIEDAIQSGPGLELPVLNNYVGSDTASIRTNFSDTGYATIDVEELYAENEEDIDESSLDLVKIPGNMDRSTAEELFKKSLRRAPVLDAISYLVGSWRFSASLSTGTDLKVKYADLESANIEEAISKAIAAQGWSDSTFGETGVDQSGNTFQNGTITINEQNFNWSISACPLDEVYNVSGLPENSFYVGARLVS